MKSNVRLEAYFAYPLTSLVICQNQHQTSASKMYGVERQMFKSVLCIIFPLYISLTCRTPPMTIPDCVAPLFDPA